MEEDTVVVVAVKRRLLVSIEVKIKDFPAGTLYAPDLLTDVPGGLTRPIAPVIPNPERPILGPDAVGAGPVEREINPVLRPADPKVTHCKDLTKENVLVVVVETPPRTAFKVTVSEISAPAAFNPITETVLHPVPPDVSVLAGTAGTEVTEAVVRETVDVVVGKAHSVAVPTGS